ncbi:MAG: hypothetical protein K2I98_01910 [Prevotella sp.]|nr:hypothetical protein [Prevotella sp.]
MNKTVFGLMMCAALGFAATSQAQDNEKADTTQRRLTIGGYGEAVMSRNLYGS